MNLFGNARKHRKGQFLFTCKIMYLFEYARNQSIGLI